MAVVSRTLERTSGGFPPRAAHCSYLVGGCQPSCPFSWEKVGRPGRVQRERPGGRCAFAVAVPSTGVPRGTRTIGGLPQRVNPTSQISSIRTRSRVFSRTYVQRPAQTTSSRRSAEDDPTSIDAPRFAQQARHRGRIEDVLLLEDSGRQLVRIGTALDVDGHLGDDGT